MAADNSILNQIFIALWLTIPIVVGGVAHMFFVTHNWLPALKTPINTRLFGENKTWRGVVVMPLVTIPGAWLLLQLLSCMPDSLELALQNISFVWLGLLLGLGYVIMELPNSLMKRQMGIAAGETPVRSKYLFIMIDQWDSALGFGAVYWFYVGLPIVQVLIMVLLFPIVALTVKRLLFLASLKKSAV